MRGPIVDSAGNPEEEFGDFRDRYRVTVIHVWLVWGGLWLQTARSKRPEMALRWRVCLPKNSVAGRS